MLDVCASAQPVTGIPWDGVHFGTYFFFLFPHPICCLPPSFFSLSLLVVTQIRAHIAGSSPSPFPLRFLDFIFIARRVELLLPSSACVETVLVASERGHNQKKYNHIHLTDSSAITPNSYCPASLKLTMGNLWLLSPTRKPLMALEPLAGQTSRNFLRMKDFLELPEAFPYTISKNRFPRTP